jgi:hypothetical protein
VVYSTRASEVRSHTNLQKQFKTFKIKSVKIVRVVDLTVKNLSKQFFVVELVEFYLHLRKRYMGYWYSGPFLVHCTCLNLCCSKFSHVKCAEDKNDRYINYSIILFSAHLKLIYIAKLVKFYLQWRRRIHVLGFFFLVHCTCLNLCCSKFSPMKCAENNNDTKTQHPRIACSFGETINDFLCVCVTVPSPSCKCEPD